MNFANIVGQTLDGKYRIEKELGKGGMGAVFLSTHLGTERPVAVKVIVPEFMERAEFVERFRREARAAGRLRHPNVVDVTDFGIADTVFGQVAYLVMEYLDGCTLGEILDEEKNLPLDWTLDILEQVCSAVHEAHRQGIIHRDLKPDNIWLEPNQRGGYTVKVLDFGIAKLEEQLGEEIADELNGPEENFGKNYPVRRTLADLSANETLAGADGATNISESATIAKTDDPKTKLSEAGTLIKNVDGGSGDEEKKTAILEPNENSDENSEDGAGTRLMTPRTFAGKHSGNNPANGQTALGQKTTKDLTRVGAVLGTPLYMSPEQCRGERLDARSDIYSLGVILYQMLSGKMPFTGDFTEVMKAHQESEPPPLDAKKVPKKLKLTVKQALAKDPDARPQTAEAFASRIRSNSEGIGSLLTRALVIYSQRLPKFLLLSILVSLPALVLTLGRSVFSFLRGIGVIEDGPVIGILATLSGITTFFAQVFTAAILVGVTTWIVAQILAVPLRPISLRTAFKKVKKRWKPLLLTVTVSTLLAMISWGMGGVGGVVGSLGLAVAAYALTGSLVSSIGLVSVTAFSAAVFFGVIVSAMFMLIAPAIMMEKIRGRKAFRRSIELTRRSFRTVVAAALLSYFIPAILGFLLAFAVGGIVNNPQIKSLTGAEDKPAAASSEGERETLNINLSTKPQIDIKSDETDGGESTKSKTMRQALIEGIFELIWSPFAILISSFTSIITALIYFKTRQAGGESMQELLREFEDTDKPQSRWQKRIQQRLEQSGRISSHG